MVQPGEVGTVIAILRKAKSLTQGQLAQRLSISAQAVSKWEGGKTLPDTAILPELARVLETTVDHLLNGGESVLKFEERMKAGDIRQGVDALRQMGGWIGYDNTVYEGLIEGINKRMNIDFQQMLNDDNLSDILFVELVLQNWKRGRYIDPSDALAQLNSAHARAVLEQKARENGVL